MLIGPSYGSWMIPSVASDRCTIHFAAPTSFGTSLPLLWSRFKASALLIHFDAESHHHRDQHAPNVFSVDLLTRLSAKKKNSACAPIMISIILPCVSSELQGTRAPGTSLSTSEPFLAHSANTHSAIPSSSYQRARALPTWGLDVAVFGESKSRSAHTAVVKTPPYQTPSARQRRQARNGGSFDGPSPQLSRLGSFFVLDIEFTASSSFSGMTHPTGDSPSNQASRSASSHGTHSFFFSSDLSRSPQGFLHRTATRA